MIFTDAQLCQLKIARETNGLDALINRLEKAEAAATIAGCSGCDCDVCYEWRESAGKGDPPPKMPETL